MDFATESTANSKWIKPYKPGEMTLDRNEDHNRLRVTWDEMFIQDQARIFNKNGIKGNAEPYTMEELPMNNADPERLLATIHAYNVQEQERARQLQAAKGEAEMEKLMMDGPIERHRLAATLSAYYTQAKKEAEK